MATRLGLGWLRDWPTVEIGSLNKLSLHRAGPLVGDRVFREFMKERFGNSIFRLVHAGDWVPQVSPMVEKRVKSVGFFPIV